MYSVQGFCPEGTHHSTVTLQSSHIPAVPVTGEGSDPVLENEALRSGLTPHPTDMGDEA